MYPLEAITELLKYLIKISSLYLFWYLVLAGTNNEENINTLLSYFLISSAIGTFTMSQLAYYGKELRYSIKRGEISNLLVKPVSILPYYIFRVWGKKAVLIAIMFGGFSTGLLLIEGLSLANLLMFLPMLLVATCLGFTLNLFEGALTFFITEVSGVKNMTMHIVRIFSGALVPLQFFPEGLRAVVELTPFPGMIYGPTQALLSENPMTEMQDMLIVSAFWAILLLTLAMWLWRVGLRKYEAIGI